MAWTRRKIIVRTILFFSLSIVCFAGWIGWRYLDTTTSACDCGDPVDGASFALFNPFRDKAPEIAAFKVITALQTGKCQVMSPTQTYCPEKFPPFSWKLTGRTVRGDTAVLRYWLDLGGTTAPLRVTLRKQGRYWNEVDVYTEF
jgi:hypothetical protein